MPMKRADRDAWVKALRSGDYTQGRYALRKIKRTQAQYCCLGVLAMLHEVPYNLPKNGTYCWFNFGEELPSESATLPDDFRGLEGEVQDRLAAMNDKGVLFSEIADWIEENIEVEA